MPLPCIPDKEIKMFALGLMLVQGTEDHRRVEHDMRLEGPFKSKDAIKAWIDSPEGQEVIEPIDAEGDCEMYIYRLIEEEVELF